MPYTDPLLAKMEELRNRLIEKQLCREADGVHARRAEEFMRAQQKEAEPDHKADLGGRSDGKVQEEAGSG